VRSAVSPQLVSTAAASPTNVSDLSLNKMLRRCGRDLGPQLYEPMQRQNRPHWRPRSFRLTARAARDHATSTSRDQREPWRWSAETAHLAETENNMTDGRSSAALVIAAMVLVWVPACGDDDADSNGGNDAGPAGRGGSSGGGSGGQGGSGNPANCPAQAPAEGDACTTAELECAYASTECTCEASGAAGTIEWDCTAGGQMCPSAEPTTGDACTPGRGDCMFGARICDCLNDTSLWVCWDPATDCPAAQPAEQAACTLVGIECEYDGQGPGGGDCECTEAGWDCGGQFCPAAEPASASTCEPGRGECMYGARICECLNDADTWACWDPADCPATQPAEQATCDPIGMECDYEAQGGNDCDCTDTGWDCGAQFCPADAPTPAAECEGGDGVCSYGATNVCDCDNSVWVCWDPADCPATVPTEATACTTEGVICNYDASECECDDLAWQCEMDEDADGGV
jgi:hypothetical protein